MGMYCGTSGVSRLTFIDSTLDHMGCLNILEKIWSRMNKIGDDFLFQLDSDPKHTTHNAKLWPLYNIKTQLRTSPQSPDLNPIFTRSFPA